MIEISVSEPHNCDSSSDQALSKNLDAAPVPTLSSFSLFTNFLNTSKSKYKYKCKYKYNFSSLFSILKSV
jgi:hypothetical protein